MPTCITKLSLWQPITANNNSALQNFSIALDQAKSAMKGMFHMDDLNKTHVHVLRQLREKLSRHIRSKGLKEQVRPRV